ncbi:uncharacterized protein LOC133203694 [Saccostrea echinata]|uniref:uncharacterized protein LOC133203694 n=1 Tax=Saccostrea echinata TaxID=191078 RepID=UPI002A7ED884|nr:uncharacterized protein LOC133203694 [Saccostrea echinata]
MKMETQSLQEGKVHFFLAENTNGDICYSDVNAPPVVVMDKRGRVRFPDDGKNDQIANSFCPLQIVTDPSGRIIVTDVDDACLHIFVMDGQFLLLLVNCGLDKPRGLSVNSEERLWVGFLSSDLRMIQYTM